MQDLENKDEKDLSTDGKEETLARVYEVGYLLIPTIPEEEVPAVYSGLKDLIVSLGGSIVADETDLHEARLARHWSKVRRIEDKAALLVTLRIPLCGSLRGANRISDVHRSTDGGISLQARQRSSCTAAPLETFG